MPGATVPGAGTGLAPAPFVGVRRFQDLECWKLSRELKLGVYALVAHSAAKSDFKFRDQIIAAVASAPSNLSEAFGAWGHPDAARYARIAKASLTETQNHLLDGVDRHFWRADEIEALMALSDRAIGATIGWIRYLTKSKPPRAHWD